MTPQEIISSNPKAFVLTPRTTYDYALMGVTSDGRLIYSESKILVALQEFEGMNYEEALDHYAKVTVSSLANGTRYAPVLATETV